MQTSMNILIAGTGYVGLTTGVALAYLGHDVICLEPDDRKIDQLMNGDVPVYEPGLEELAELSRANLRFVKEYRRVDFSPLDVIFIAVGTPPKADGSPDLSHLQTAAESIGSNLGDGFTVIVNKSTVPIGSGNWVEALIRDAFESRNGRSPAGRFAVASNPEFLREGSALLDTFYPDRIVLGAENPEAIDVLTNLYRPILNQDFTPPEFLPRPEGLVAVPLVTTDLASAELVKYAANSFLALKISYINEIAQLAERVGADVRQIARGIGLDTRIGSRFLNAGIGWGGSCFGKDTAALLSISAEYGLDMPIVKAAREVNYRQRAWVVEKLLQELRLLKGRTICLLGLSFKPNTDDVRDAPALDIADLLTQRGVRVQAFDPVAMERSQEAKPDLRIHYCASPFEAAKDADAVVLLTEWPEFRQIDWVAIKGAMRVPLVLDGRNFLPSNRLEELGFRYVGVGRGRGAGLVDDITSLATSTQEWSSGSTSGDANQARSSGGVVRSHQDEE